MPASVDLMTNALTNASMLRPSRLDIPLGGTFGRYDGITDVAGVEVGVTSLIRGEGKLGVNRGPLPDVTAISPPHERLRGIRKDYRPAGRPR